MQTLIKEVRGLNPSFESSNVLGTTNVKRDYVVIKLYLSIIICRGGIRFYRSKCDAHSASVNGKTEVLKTRKRRHERVVRVSFYFITLTT